MKVVGYTRVSKQSRAKSGISLRAQGSMIKKWAKLNKLRAIVFKDDGISGKRLDNRLGLSQALNTATKGDIFIFYALSRLSRKTLDILTVAEQLNKKDVRLLSLLENFDMSNAAGRMAFRTQAVLAEFEADVTGERTKAALTYKKSKKEKTGGTVPFGYNVFKGKLYKNKKEQKTIKRAKKLRAAGLTLRKIGKILAHEKHKTKSKRFSWHASTVSRLFTF